MENQKTHPTLTLNYSARPLALRFWGLRLKDAWRAARTGLIMLGLFAAFLAVVQFSTPDMPDNDGFYHIKLAYLMRTEGLKPNFHWLPLSILNAREFYDHHFLFHVALIPFTFGDLRVGAKLGAVAFASLAFLSVWRLLKNQRIPFAELWALALVAVSEAFIFRMSITRAQSLSLLVLMVSFDAFLRKKYRSQAVLAFLYVWLYDAFPLLIIYAVIATGTSALYEHRLDLRPMLYTSAGIAAGLVINPYFPHNIVFAVQHILPKLADATTVSVGNEWFPYDTSVLLKNSPLALAFFFSGALALGFSGKRMDLRTLMSLLLAGLFGVMTFQSRRFIEYFPVFALVFAAFAWTPVIENLLRGENGAFTGQKRFLGWDIQGLALRLALIVVLVPGTWLTLRGSQTAIQTSKPWALYANASQWLAENSPEGERVFQTDWDDFPRLFYHNSHNTYLIGLDPTYMQLYNDELYRQWVDITRGRVENPGHVIMEKYGARYVITDLLHTGFIKQAGADPNMSEVYRDEEAIIYLVSLVTVKTPTTE